MGRVVAMANRRRGILSNLARLASFSQGYRPSPRGISILGDDVDTLERMNSLGNSSKSSISRNFSKLGNGNIATTAMTSNNNTRKWR